jgi:hypothetical protein
LWFEHMTPARLLAPAPAAVESAAAVESVIEALG